MMVGSGQWVGRNSILTCWFMFTGSTNKDFRIVTPKSGVFLAGSCISAIAAVGSVFELSSGNPELGNAMTSTILAVTIPLVVIFFMAAVRDARANQK